MRNAVLATMIAAAVLLPSHVFADLVTECGQQVNGSGRLAADLDCTDSADGYIQVRGSLRLDGHVLTADVRCGQALLPSGFDAYSCSVRGPGTLRGCIYAPTKVSVSGITMSTPPGSGGCAAEAAIAGSRIRVSDSEISGFPTGINGGFGGGREAISVINSSIHDCAAAAIVNRGVLRLKGSDVSGAVSTGKSARLLRSSITSSGWIGLGAFGDDSFAGAPSILLVDSEVSGAFAAGAVAGRVTLRRSDVNGNCGGNVDCADIVAADFVHLDAASSCGTSLNSSTDTTFGVCAGD